MKTILLPLSVSVSLMLTNTQAADLSGLSKLTYQQDASFIQKMIPVDSPDYSCILPDDDGHPDVRFYTEPKGEIYAFYMDAPYGEQSKTHRSSVFGKKKSVQEKPVAILYGINIDGVEDYTPSKISSILPEFAEKKRTKTVVFARKKRSRDQDVNPMMKDPRNAIAAKKGLTPLAMQHCADNRLCLLTNANEFLSVHNCRSGSQSYLLDYADFSVRLHKLETYIREFDAQSAQSLENPKLLGRFIKTSHFQKALKQANTSTKLSNLRKIADIFGHLDKKLISGLQQRQKNYSFNENYKRMITNSSTLQEIRAFLAIYAGKKTTDSQKNILKELKDKAYLMQTRQAFESGDFDKIAKLLKEHPDEASEIRSRFQHLYRKRGRETQKAKFYVLSYRMEPNRRDFESFLRLASDKSLNKELKSRSFTHDKHLSLLVQTVEKRQEIERRRKAAELKRQEAIRKAQEARAQAMEIAGKTFVDDEYAMMWQDVPKSAYIRLNWKRAVNYCKRSTVLGFNDWTLPNNHNLAVLYRKRKHLKHLEEASYWSRDEKISNRSQAFEMDFDSGIRDNADKEEKHHVRCVRNLPKKIGYYD